MFPTSCLRAPVEREGSPTLKNAADRDPTTNFLPTARIHVVLRDSTTKTEGACAAGGERGIRTLGTFRYTRFPIVPLRPLGHLPEAYFSRGEGGSRTHVG